MKDDAFCRNLEGLIRRLKEEAEWAEANEWETPITLADDLRAAANMLTMTAIVTRLQSSEGPGN